MAYTLSNHLKLRLEEGLTANARYNLQRLDEIGKRVSLSVGLDSILTSQKDLHIRAQDPEVGGTGVGGNVTIGSSTQTLTQLAVYASTLYGNFDVSTSGTLKIRQGDFHTGFAGPTTPLAADAVYKLPPADGDATQVLATDGAGTLSWSSVLAANLAPGRVVVSNEAGNVTASNLTLAQLTYIDDVTSAVQGQIDGLQDQIDERGRTLAVAWDTADGTSKTVTHNWGTRNVKVEVVDTADSHATIEVDSVTRPTTNTVALTSSSAPSSSWQVMLQEVFE